MPATTLERSPCASELSISTLQKLDDLTPTEHLVLTTLLKTGESNTELAERLNTKVKTIHTHLNAIHKKLKVDRTTELFNLLPELVPPQPEQIVVQITPMEGAITPYIHLTNTQIGKILNLSKRTIESHLANFYSKLYVKNKRKYLAKRSRFILEVGRGGA